MVCHSSLMNYGSQSDMMKSGKQIYAFINICNNACVTYLPCALPAKEASSRIFDVVIDDVQHGSGLNSHQV